MRHDRRAGPVATAGSCPSRCLWSLPKRLTWRRDSMRSRLGVAAALLLLLTPVAAIASVVLNESAPNIVVHLFLGAGCLVFALAVFDFGLPRWINVVGAISGIAFGTIFLLQALSLMVPSEQLTYVAFTMLGQTAEGILVLAILA